MSEIDVSRYFSTLWNAMPFEERKRLSGHTTETQLRTILAVREIADRNHKRFLRELDDWAANVRKTLNEQIVRDMEGSKEPQP